MVCPMLLNRNNHLMIRPLIFYLVLPQGCADVISRAGKYGSINMFRDYYISLPRMFPARYEAKRWPTDGQTLTRM